MGGGDSGYLSIFLSISTMWLYTIVMERVGNISNRSKYFFDLISCKLNTGLISIINSES